MKPGPVTHTVHYPSTAELALFRQSIAGHPDAMIDMHPDAYPSFGIGAWPVERVDGIGYRGSQHSFADDLSGAMSRWAGEERSAAYERMTK